MSPFRERNESRTAFAVRMLLTKVRAPFFTTDAYVKEKKRDNDILKPTVYTDFFVYKTALCTKVRNQKAVRNVFI